MKVPLSIPRFVIAALVTILLVGVGCSGENEGQTRSLEIAGPCVEGDCEPRDVSGLDLFSGSLGSNAVAFGESLSATVEEVLEKGLRLAEASPVHLAVRGTVSANTVRCEWRGIARSLAQREEAIRFWLDLEDSDPMPSLAEVERRITAELNRMNPIYPATVKSNFQAISKGGLSTDFMFLTCHTDYTVSEYLLGGGPTTLGVAYDRMGEARSFELYRQAHEWGEFGEEVLMSEGEYEEYLTQHTQYVELLLGALLGGRESVAFLAPMGAHNAIAIEAWQAVAQWDLQEDDNEVVHAVRYGALEGDPEYIQTLANLKSRITAATTTPSEGASGSSNPRPTRIANASGLSQYYRDMGAYADITPDDGTTETFTPAQPPEVYDCAGGIAVTDSETNRGLLHDCEALLGGKDTMKGSGTLNWAPGTAIASWDGLTVAGTPNRVTKVELDDESLSGSIPPELGNLFELTHLDLSDNSLTGSIPHELGWLYNLESLKLSGNSLTGCIPIVLKDVATNDLSSLNQLYCQPPAPGTPTAGTATLTSQPLSWTSAANTSKYRVEYREGTVGSWTVDDESITGTTHTVDGLRCDTEYQFRLSAFGSGTTYAAAWSEPSEALTASTGMCVAPVFDQESFVFSVLETASLGTVVGVASATDPNEDTLTYTIVSGNEDGKFAINTSTGAITVAAALDYDATPSYSLKVDVSDGSNDASVTVEITVTDVNMPPVFLHEGFSFSVNESMGLHGSVGYVVAKDPEGGTVTYSITGGNSNGQFAIDLNLGLIVVRRSLDHDTKSSYTLTVRVRDQLGNASSASVAIAVVETAEDPPPAPVGLTTRLEEAGDLIVSWHEVANASMYRVRHRTDQGGEWTTSAAAAGTSRTLSGVTCGVTYEVQVEAQGDGVSYTIGWSDASASVSKAVPLCPAPVFGETSYDLTVTENAPVGTEVGTVAATYPDQTKLTYSITAGNDEGKFSIGAGGVITLAGTLDHETTPAYTLTVQAVEPRGKSGTASVTVTVADVNEVPSFDAEVYTFTVAEDSAIGHSVGTAVATDPEEDTLTYRITAGDDDGDFSIDASGDISVAKALDFETASSYTLTVEAADPGGLSETASVTVTVTDVNEAPVFDATEYTFRVAENSAVGTLVGTVAATDPDDGATLTYSISGETFEIDADTGAITVSVALDHEATESYSFTVSVEDEEGESGTVSVTITVTDVNEAPSFDAAAYTFTVAENAVLGGLLGTVSATDPDADDTLSYSIGGVDFTISAGGAVTVARTLDYETAGTYNLTAKVEDGGGLSNTAEVSITVTDVDETPAFDAEVYTFTLSEDAAVGTVVGTLTASDANERQGEILTYSVEGDAAFTIDASTGALKVASALDYETYLVHELNATVTDETDLTDTASISIRVRDVAEVTPPVPGGLTTALKIRESSFDLSWNTVDGADQYRIQYRIGHSSGKWTNLGALKGTSQRFTPEGGIRCSTTHEFRVQAHGDGETHPARWGSRSHAVRADRRSCISPAAPTDLTANVEGGTVVLSWTAPAGSEITAYQILRRRPTAEQELLVLVENTGSTNTTYTDSTVEAGVHYIYRVKAINNTISGPISNRAEVRIRR